MGAIIGQIFAQAAANELNKTPESPTPMAVPPLQVPGKVVMQAPAPQQQPAVAQPSILNQLYSMGKNAVVSDAQQTGFLPSPPGTADKDKNMLAILKSLGGL